MEINEAIKIPNEAPYFMMLDKLSKAKAEEKDMWRLLLFFW